MCEHEFIVLSAIIVMLTVIILLLLYLFTVKSGEKLTKLIQALCRTIIFLNYFNQQSRATRHPSQLNGKNYKVRHIFCRRTPPPPKLNLLSINFGVINFFVDLGALPVS